MREMVLHWAQVLISGAKTEILANAWLGTFEYQPLDTSLCFRFAWC